MNFINIFLKSMLIDNVVFIQYLAICPFVGMTTETDKATGMGIATTFVIVLATAVTWPIYNGIMVPLGLEYLQTLIFILVIAALVQLVEFYLKKSIPGLYSAMGVYLALITTNCAVLAITINCINKYSYGYIESLVYALGSAVGFLIAMVIMAGVREHMKSAPIPKIVKGKPILFITAGLLSLSFLGFNGLIK
ncbi:MAG: electron transport complex subunit RsxA [Treponema sp.]|nr:electron transport complex subunit RsxA [Treponema sp.]